MLRNFGQALWALLMLVTVAQAQFNFFEHMFGANQQQQHQQQGSQNVPSDSGRYQNSWRQGESSKLLIGWILVIRGINGLLILDVICRSAMQQLPLPRDTRLRLCSSPLPMPASRC